MSIKNFKKSKTVDTEYLPGDIGLERSTGFLPRSIQLFMKVYKKLKGEKPTEVYNHAFVIIDIWGKLFVVEALGNGVNIKTFAGTYEGKSNVKYKTPIKPYSEAEKQKISDLATSLVYDPHRYDYISLLLWQPLFVLTGKWFGKKNGKATGRFYCSESRK